MKKTSLLAWVLLLLPFAFQVEANEGFEITLHSGWSFLNEEQEVPQCIYCRESFFGKVTTTIDSSPVLGVKAGYFLNASAEVEGQFVISPSHRVVTDNSFVCPPGEICPLSLFPFFRLERNLIAYQYGGNFLYHFGRDKVRPFVTFGVGGVSSDIDQSTNHDFAFQFGGGSKFYFNKIGFRVELIDQVIPDYFLTRETHHDVQLHYGLVFQIP